MNRYYNDWRLLNRGQIIGMARVIAERGWRRVTLLVTPRGCKKQQKRKVYVNDELPGYWSLIEAYTASCCMLHIAWQKHGRLHRHNNARRSKGGRVLT